MISWKIMTNMERARTNEPSSVHAPEHGFRGTYADLERSINAIAPQTQLDRQEKIEGAKHGSHKLLWLIFSGIAVISIGGIGYLIAQHGRESLPMYERGAVLPATPDTGVLQWHKKPGQGIRTGQIHLHTAKNSLQTVVRVETWHESELIADVYVRPGETAILRVPVGSYRLNLLHGTAWMGSPESAFGKATLMSVYPTFVNVVEDIVKSGVTSVDVSRSSGEQTKMGLPAVFRIAKKEPDTL